MMWRIPLRTMINAVILILKTNIYTVNDTGLNSQSGLDLLWMSRHQEIKVISRMDKVLYLVQKSGKTVKQSVVEST